MIKITCAECKALIDPIENKQAYFEFDLVEKCIIFKCPDCKKISKLKLYKEDKPLPKIVRM